MTDDPKLKAFLVNAIAYGLKTGATEENLDDYCSGLVEFICNQENPAWAQGDRDGILITNIHNDGPTMVVLPKPGITEFRMLGDFPLDDPGYATVCFRVVLAVVGWSIQFSPDKDITPAGGISAGDLSERVFKFEDHDFGIV